MITKTHLMYLITYCTLIILGINSVNAQNNNSYSKANDKGGSRDNYLTVTYPNGGQYWEQGEQYTITWDTDLPYGTYFRVDLVKGPNGSTTTTTILESTPANSYTWTVPSDQTIGDDYRIEVEEIGGSFLTDMSNNFFSIGAPYLITVTSPDGGESWLRGSTHNITWTANFTGFVNIRLYKNGSYNSNIVSNTPCDDGSYSWTIPDSLTLDDDYKVLIEASFNTTLYDYSNANFTITGPPFITVINPNGGQLYDWDDQVGISWNDNIAENVKIELYKGGTLNQTIVSSTPSDGYFGWDIPDDISGGNDYKVKITSINTGSLYDYSDNNFTINAKTITVTSPNGGETWIAGETHHITWSDNIPENVKIELYKGGTLNQTIVSSTPSDGFYNWHIPDDFAGGGNDYKIKITSVNTGSVYDFSDNNFTINPKTITVTSPNGGETWNAGEDYQITWSANFSEYVRIQLFKNGTYNSTIDDYTPSSDGTYLWTIPSSQTPGIDYKIKIVNCQQSTIFDYSDNRFAIYKNLEVTSPNGGENWAKGSTHNITWTGAPWSSNVKIELYDDKGGLVSMIAGNYPNNGSFAWTISSSLTSAEYKIKITTLDGTIEDDLSDNTFTISGVNYLITVISPNGGENWQAGSTHTITWTDNLPDDVKIKLYKGTNVDYDIVYSTPSDGSYSWTIPSDQEAGTNYRVRISGNTNFVVDFSNSYFTISAAGPPDYDTVQNVTINNGETECFDATNTIVVAGSGTAVEVSSGGEANFIAGQKVLFKPGFHAYPGSYMHTFITTTNEYCSSLPPATATPSSTNTNTKEGLATVSDLNGSRHNQQVNVYPNPTSGNLTIDFNGEETTAVIRVINFQGSVILKTEMSKQIAKKIDLQFLPEGMYVLVINTQGEQITKKIIKNY